MIIGIPTEVKKEEHRVGIVPAGVKALVSQNHKVIIQRGAGLDSGITDQEYRSAGAAIMDKAGKIYDDAEMIMKVKEPLPEEYQLLHEGQILYTYLHLAPAL
nr:alanine dehydrogenase [candidate division Zixibacteria bacterium]